MVRMGWGCGGCRGLAVEKHPRHEVEADLKPKKNPLKFFRKGTLTGNAHWCENGGVCTVASFLMIFEKQAISWISARVDNHDDLCVFFCFTLLLDPLDYNSRNFRSVIVYLCIRTFFAWWVVFRARPIPCHGCNFNERSELWLLFYWQYLNFLAKIKHLDYHF